MDHPYLEVISYVERLHRQFLEVVKLELEGLGIHDINASAATGSPLHRQVIKVDPKPISRWGGVKNPFSGGRRRHRLRVPKPRPKNDPGLHRPEQHGVAKGAPALRPETRRRHRIGQANTPRRAAGPVIPHLAAGGLRMKFDDARSRPHEEEGMTTTELGAPPNTGWAKLVPE